MGLLCSSRKFWLIIYVFHAGHSYFIIQLLYIGTKLLFIPYPPKEIALVNGNGFPLPHSADEVTTIVGLYFGIQIPSNFDYLDLNWLQESFDVHK